MFVSYHVLCKFILTLTLLISELTSGQDLIEHLRVTYQKVVEGEGSALIGAKSIVTTAVHFYRNHGQLSVPVCSVFLVKCTCDL